MKPTRPTPRLYLALASLLFVLAGSLFFTGCTTSGDGNNTPDHSQHSGHNM
jgi:uncharacterized lipoprotein YajG